MNVSKDEDENFLADLDGDADEDEDADDVRSWRRRSQAADDNPDLELTTRRRRAGPSGSSGSDAGRRATRRRRPASRHRLNRISTHVPVAGRGRSCPPSGACLPCAPRPSSRAQQVLVAHDLGADEASREVGVDRAGRVDGGRAVGDRPGADLVGARGQERDQAEQLVGQARSPGPGWTREAEVLQEHGGLVGLELADLHLDLAPTARRPASWLVHVAAARSPATISGVARQVAPRRR